MSNLIQHKTINGAQDGPHVLIIGGVHGDEFEPMAAIRRLMRELDASTLRGRVTLVPVVNEAAFVRGQRTADDDLDLARTCPGKSDGSITERIAHEISEMIRDADYLIDLHTGGNAMQVAPLAGYTLHEDDRVIRMQQRMAKAFNLPIVWGTCPNLNGRTLSVARDANIPAIYAEWMGAGVCDPQGIEDYFQGCLNVLAELEMIDREKPESKVEFFVEDPRDQSGHLQLNYPAPTTGFFEPNVTLLDKVKIGQPLGTISDILGERVETIPSTQNGRVIVLRVFTRVLEGESLAVILEDQHDN